MVQSTEAMSLDPFSFQDTIVAVSTPPGRGGIGIVRLSGPHAKQIAEPVLKLRQPLAHAAARFAEIVSHDLQDNQDAAKLDEAVVTYFAAPNSYTMEDVVEIAAHGSPVVLDFLVRHALAHGARLARPGEFTERAFLSGRIDLTQAEAVRDLIEAQTIVQARLAAEQMGGALSRRIAPAKELLVSLIAALEAGVDFAEDDIDVLPAAAIAAHIEQVQQQLEPIAASYAAGRIVHDGLTLAIVGKPNAGKSSLFNRLVERDRAIVTPIAGTTRDLVTERVAIGGIPIQLIDTAGLRATNDQAEMMGIAKTHQAMAEADVILAVTDVTDREQLSAGEDEEWLRLLNDHRTVIVLNKVDLVDTRERAMLLSSIATILARVLADASIAQLKMLPVSALAGTGIDELRKQILTTVQAGGNSSESGMLTSVRHYEAIRRSQDRLAAAHAALAQQIPHEMLLLDLYRALEGMDSLTGTTTTEDILTRIFSTFCIGK